MLIGCESENDIPAKGGVRGVVVVIVLGDLALGRNPQTRHGTTVLL